MQFLGIIHDLDIGFTLTLSMALTPNLTSTYLLNLSTLDLDLDFDLFLHSDLDLLTLTMGLTVTLILTFPILDLVVELSLHLLGAVLEHPLPHAHHTLNLVLHASLYLFMILSLINKDKYDLR